MDLLDEFVQDNHLSQENILRVVDCYSIYSFYIGSELELRTKYSSPLRDGDNDPSFSLYDSRNDSSIILFKDNMSGKFGNVFTFVKELMSTKKLVTIKDALLQINSDFGLGLGDDEVSAFKPHLIKTAPIIKSVTNIEVTNRVEFTQEFKDYWHALDISNSILDLYYATNPKIIHYIADYHTSIVPRDLTIAYEILGKYKIYHPFAEKKYKFRNNYDTTFVEGAMQLTFKSDFVIITKATKECMWFRQHFDWDSVAGKSETTKISSYFMNKVLFKNYKYVFIWLDGDEAGIKSQAEYLQLYPQLIPIVMEDSIEQKDVTDFYLAGKNLNKQQMVLDYVKQLILNNINGRINN